MFADCSFEKGLDKSATNEKKVIPRLHDASRTDLRRSIKDGCSICAYLGTHKFRKSIFRFMENQSHDFDLEIECSRSRSPAHSSRILFHVQQVDTPSIDLVRASLCEPYTGHENVARLAEYWLKTCLEKHEHCPGQEAPSQYPSRLLDLVGTQVRLIDCAKERPSLPYATISHCWGREPFFSLTSRTKQRLQCGVPFSEFPHSFQDAMITARWFGIRYIWIDCYCIIQLAEESSEGEKEEARKYWIAESTKMRNVYANGLINFGATHARNPFDGCFTDREIVQANDFTISWRPSSQNALQRYHVYHFSFAHANSYDFYHRHALMERGWILQERVLAPRTLHFGNCQIYWECPGLPNKFACEALPGGFPPCHSYEFVSLTRSDDGGNLVPMYWGDVLLQYSQLALSYPLQDKLTALAGIAEQFAKISDDDDYIAGFFRKNFLCLACWGSEERSSRAKEWHAPSWSWASMDGQLKMLLKTHFREVASIVDSNIELLDPNMKYGPLRSGSIVVRGRLLNREVRKRKRNQWIDPEKAMIRISFDDMEEMQSVKRSLAFLPLILLGPYQLYGLLLQQEKEGIYRRLGVWDGRLQLWETK